MIFKIARYLQTCKTFIAFAAGGAGFEFHHCLDTSAQFIPFLVYIMLRSIGEPSSKLLIVGSLVRFQVGGRTKSSGTTSTCRSSWSRRSCLSTPTTTTSSWASQRTSILRRCRLTSPFARSRSYRSTSRSPECFSTG